MAMLLCKLNREAVAEVNGDGKPDLVVRTPAPTEFALSTVSARKFLVRLPSHW
jgi:hypothetical protein